MGIYLELPYAQHKADQLIKHHNAKRIDQPLALPDEPNMVLVCVVQNDYFDAAAIVTDKQDMRRFTPWREDDRERTWLLVPEEEVLKLCPHAR